MLELTNAQFGHLYNRLLEKLKQEYVNAKKIFPEDLKTTRLFGLGEYAHDQYLSFRTLIRKNEQVKDYLKELKTLKESVKISKGSKKTKGLKRPKKNTSELSAESLYKSYGEYKARRKKISLTKTYEHVYSLILGFEDLDVFFDKDPVVSKKVNFDIFYFSKIDWKTLSFPLTLEISEGKIRASAKNFHTNFQEVALDGDDDDIDLIGHCWVISLENKDKGLYLELSIHVGATAMNTHENLLKANFLSGILHGLSSHSHPFSLECVLINEKCPNKTQAEGRAQKYLNLMRNNFHVDIAKNLVMPDSIEQLMIQNHSLSKIDHIAGMKFRILTYNVKEEKVLQSRFTIEDDFLAKITMPDRKPMNCFISINNSEGPMLVVEVMDADWQGLSAFTIFEIPDKPKKNEKKKKEIVHGAFYSRGSAKKKPVGGLFVMIEDDSVFDVTTYPKEGLEQTMAAQNMGELREELYIAYGLKKDVKGPQKN